MKLKAHKSIHDKTPVQCSKGSSVHCCKPLNGLVHQLAEAISTYRINCIGGGDDGRVEEDGEEFDKHEHVEEEDNFFPANGGVFRSDMEEHNTCHAKGSDMNEACR